MLIESIADSVGRENMLLFDCGDFSQGSLYYNSFKGSTEIELMNAMGYNAGTLGNHEFDFGLENLARIIKMAKFDFVCANYDFTGTVCEGLVKPYTIIECSGKKIGVFGLSPDPKGLISQENYEGVTFTSPVKAAKRCVNELKEQKCDAIVCLSHLGWKIKNEYNDERLAAETAGIDIILGGHSHDYFEAPLTYSNSEGKDVIMHAAPETLPDVEATEDVTEEIEQGKSGCKALMSGTALLLALAAGVVLTTEKKNRA